MSFEKMYCNESQKSLNQQVLLTNSSMEGDERGISVKLISVKFLVKIKIKQNSGCVNKECIAIFKDIHQNIRAYSRSKKNLDRSMIGKIFLHVTKNQGIAR